MLAKQEGNMNYYHYFVLEKLYLQDVREDLR